jgi:hypothetical protein
VDLPTFRAQYPEMASVPDPMITAYLARAANRLDPLVWGTKLEEGIGLLTAHLLALSPAGLSARLATDKGQSTYGEQFSSLERVVSIALRTT